MSSAESELQKEFELERLILFSDAVFAIGITLLVIEIKFPEIPKGATSSEIFELFKPTIIHFLAFIFSFFFIGVMWSRHLKIFKYLRSYNAGVIRRNLVFLFFIVCFPFTASGITEHIRPSFLFPVYLYFINLAFVSIANYSLCNYVFKRHAYLSVSTQEAQTKYIVMQSKYSAAVFTTTVIVVLALSFVFPKESVYVLYGFYLLPLLMIVVRKKLKKYKPAEAVR